MRAQHRWAEPVRGAPTGRRTRRRCPALVPGRFAKPLRDSTGTETTYSSWSCDAQSGPIAGCVAPVELELDEAEGPH